MFSYEEPNNFSYLTYSMQTDNKTPPSCIQDATILHIRAKLALSTNQSRSNELYDNLLKKHIEDAFLPFPFYFRL